MTAPTTHTEVSAGRWGVGVTESRRVLEALRFGCIRLCELACAALVRCDPIPTKLALSRHVWALAQAADLIGARLPGLRSTAEAAVPGSPGYVAFTNQIAALPDPDLQHRALVHLLYPDLRAAIMAHFTRLPDLADELTRECLATVLEKLDAIVPVPEAAPAAMAALGEQLERCGGVAGPGPGGAPEVPAGRALAEIPRRPGRPPGLREAREGESVTDGTAVAALHNTIFRIELAAAEICAATLAYHPEAPWPLRYDLAKQVRDEARHFELFTARMRELGGDLGDYPYRMDVWDKFLVGTTLPERLMIEQRIGEGTGLDSARRTLRALQLSGDHKTAMIYEYVVADEITHVGNGSAWIRRLLERDEDLSEVESTLRERLAARGLAVPLTDPINTVDRRLSGFRPSEIEALREARRTADARGAEPPR